MEVLQKKACLIEKHDNNFMVSMCLDKKCQKQSRSICQQCFLEQDNFDKDCNTLVSFDGQQNNPLKLYYKNKHFDMKKALEFINQYEDEQQKKVDQKINNLVKEVVKSIVMIGKSLKIQVLEKNSEIKQRIKENLKRLNQFEDLRDLQEIFYQFKHGSQTIEDLNQKLKEKQQQSINLDTLYWLKNDFEEIEQKGVIYDSFFYDLQQNINNNIEKYQNISQSQLRDKTHINIIHFSNQYQYEGFDKSLNTIELKTLKKMCFRTEKSFKKEIILDIQFQIKYDTLKYQQHLLVGVIPAELVQENNKINFKDQNLYNLVVLSYNSRKCTQLRDKTLSEVYKSDQICDLNICYEKNKFTLQDKSKEALSEFQGSYDQQYDEWYLLFQIPSGHSFRQIKHSILSPNTQEQN